MLSPKLLQTKWYNRLTNDSGSTLIEYALMVGMIAMVAVAAVILLGSQVSNPFNQTTSNLAGISQGALGNSNSGGSNAGGNSGGSNAGGNSGGSNAGGNSGGGNAGGNGKK